MINKRALRALTAVSLGCLLTPAYAAVLGSLPMSDTGRAIGETLVGVPIWINRQLPQTGPWSDHIAQWRREGYAAFDLLLVSFGAGVAWFLLPPRLGVLPGIAALFPPMMAVMTFGWLATPSRPPLGLAAAVVVGLSSSLLWAYLSSTRVKPTDRRSLFLLAVVVLGCLAVLFERIYHYLFLASALVTFASSAILLAAWHSVLKHGSLHAV